MSGGFLRRAVAVARAGMEAGQGGPFGAVIVRDGEIIGEGCNRVLADNDPTAHAEITAIRHACTNLGTFDLKGCEIYVNAMPCPMCMTAIFWARIDKIYYACGPAETASIGFDDQHFYEELDRPPAARERPALQIADGAAEARALFADYLARDNNRPY
jgi:tRNA(Arg) A34 adenosine deaminase TadA